MFKVEAICKTILGYWRKNESLQKDKKCIVQQHQRNKKCNRQFIIFMPAYGEWQFVERENFNKKRVHFSILCRRRK